MQQPTACSKIASTDNECRAQTRRQPQQVAANLRNHVHRHACCSHAWAVILRLSLLLGLRLDLLLYLGLDSRLRGPALLGFTVAPVLQQLLDVFHR